MAKRNSFAQIVVLSHNVIWDDVPVVLGTFVEEVMQPES